MSTQPYRIDVHHHIVPSEYVEALKSIGITTSGRIPFPEWTPETSIGMMDRALSTGMTMNVEKKSASNIMNASACTRTHLSFTFVPSSY